MLDAPRNFIKNSPVTSLTTAESISAAVLTFLVTHHVIGSADVSTTTQTIAPFVALALPAVFGAAKWSLVTPFAKIKQLSERDGLVSDADFARFDALLDEKLQAFAPAGFAIDDAVDDAAEEDFAADEDADADADIIDADTVDGGDFEDDQVDQIDHVDELEVTADDDVDHRPEHLAADRPADDVPSGMAAGAEPAQA